MIVTVTLNAAWDRTYFVEALRTGAVHLVSEVRGCPGGKGINVARAFTALGGRALATGFLGGFTGQAILAGLKAENIEADFFTISGESRGALAIVDRASGTVTELREPGAVVTPDELRGFEVHLSRLLGGASFCVISGSLPRGAAPGTYAGLIRLARASRVRVILDTSGPALAEGLAAGPFMIKPNLDEAVSLLRTLDASGGGRAAVPVAAGAAPAAVARDPVRIASEVARRLTRRRAEPDPAAPELVLVSLGELGAVLGQAGRLWHARVRLDRVCNPVGSGDAMIAGMTLALERGDEPARALRLAVAAGAANALTATAGRVRPEDARDLLPEVEVNELTGAGAGGSER